jgi:hypothetical protein
MTQAKNSKTVAAPLPVPTAAEREQWQLDGLVRHIRAMKKNAAETHAKYTENLTKEDGFATSWDLDGLSEASAKAQVAYVAEKIYNHAIEFDTTNAVRIQYIEEQLLRNALGAHRSRSTSSATNELETTKHYEWLSLADSFVSFGYRSIEDIAEAAATKAAAIAAIL